MAWLVAPGNHVATLDTRKPSTVGSHPACTLVMKEELGIALQHYRIVPYGSEAAELHSLAPLGMEVMLNGQQVDNEPLPLSDRDTITTGDLKLIFRLTDPALDEIKPTALLEKKFEGEAPTGQAARQIAASDAPVPVFQTPAPVAGESHLTPLALESLENVQPSGPGQLPEVSPFTPLEVAPAAAVVPTQAIDALPVSVPPAAEIPAAIPLATPPEPEIAVPAPPRIEEVPAFPVATEPVVAAAPEPVPVAAQVAPTLPEPLPVPMPVAPVSVEPIPVPVPVAPLIQEPVAGIAPPVDPIPAPQVAAIPASPPEVDPVVNAAPAAPIPVAPALPGVVAPVQPPESVAPPPASAAHSSRPSELFLPKKDAPKRATDAGRRADAARRSSMRWGFRALGIAALGAWILVAVYAFVDPARNVIHDLIGYESLAKEKVQQIEATVDAKNPAAGEVGETAPAAGVAGQD